MTNKVRVLISDTYNPLFNIATEDWIFRELDPSYQTLYLWRNQGTVVIGRSQNPWTECNLKKMEDDGIYLARRASGGGAVFHDLGNTCFTFLSPKEGYNRSLNSSIITNALKTFNVDSEVSGRNDIVINADDGPRKISGSAFRETHDRAFHHGTLLINSDLTRLANYLTPHPKKLQAKGRTSVRARVMNLSELNSKITHETLSEAIIQEFFKTHQAECKVEHLDHSVLTANSSLKERYASFSDWNWRFGETREFQHQMTEYLSWGFIEVFLDSEKGLITQVKIFSDSLFPDLTDLLQTHLVGKVYSQSGIDQALGEVQAKISDKTEALEEFGNWIKKEIDT